MKLNQKNLKDVMGTLYENCDMESFDELWKAITTLYNLGLVDKNLVDAMVSTGRKLFEGEPV